MTYPLSDGYCVRHNVGKPPLPYFPGQKFEVRSHTPPAPTDIRKRGYNKNTHRERDEIHPLERCFLHPPLPGETGSQVTRLEIVEAMRLGDDRNAQLGLVQVLDRLSLLPDCLVAKFYDPLYFDHQQDDADPFLCADCNYTHETAAYIALKKFQGSIIPNYYGSYTLELPVHNGGQLRHRHVRLILMEWIPGKSMRDYDPKSFTEPERQGIMKEIVDAESAFYTNDIFHTDVYPRNVLISSMHNSRRVTLIDFDNAVIGRSRIPAFEAKMLPGIPISPLLRWHTEWGLHQNFEAWIDWDWQSWLERTYDDTRHAITDEMRRKWEPPYLSGLPQGAPI